MHYYDNLKELIKQLIIQEAPNRLPNRGRPPKKLANALAAINNAPFDQDDGSGEEPVGIKMAAALPEPEEDKRLNFQKPLDPEYKSGEFDFNDYTALKTPSERLLYVRNAAKQEPGQFRRLGAGSSRIVYDMPGTGKVLKLALNDKGIAQNKAEIEITRRIHSVSADYPLVTKIFGHDSSDEPTWLLAEGVLPITEAEFEQLTGQRWGSFYSALLSVLSSKEPTGNKFMDVLANTIRKNKLELGDIAVLQHWGKTEDGRLVMLDYGFTTAVAKKHYRGAGRTKYFEQE